MYKFLEVDSSEGYYEGVLAYLSLYCGGQNLSK